MTSQVIECMGDNINHLLLLSTLMCRYMECYKAEAETIGCMHVVSKKLVGGLVVGIIWANCHKHVALTKHCCGSCNYRYLQRSWPATVSNFKGLVGILATNSV